MAARLVKRCKAVALVTAPPGEAIPPKLPPGWGHTLLAPLLDGARLHELSDRSPLTTGGGYVAIELAPVHAPDCDALTGGQPCDCGAQAMFESFVLAGA